jgi:CRISPR-associated protein Cmr2
MATDWNELILAYLHDPPDKALDILTHVSRACRYAAIALNQSVEREQLKHTADVLASVAERLPAPRWEKLTVKPEGDRFQVKHPLSGADRSLDNCQLDTAFVEKHIHDLMDGLSDDRKLRLLALWRLLPGRLADSTHSWFANLPADTRVPDHTIWHHLDITTALKAADEGGHGAAFLSFSLGPVQTFIGTSRTVRDLWSGSMILAWLTFQAMLPVIDQHGPCALVYPSVRGLPLLDLWLRDTSRLGDRVEPPSEEKRRAPCLPNRFLAVVPCGANGCLAKDLAAHCEKRTQEAWKEMGDAVHEALNPVLSSLHGRWDQRWQEQLENFFEIRTAVLPFWETRDELAGQLIAGQGGFEVAFPAAAAVRCLADAIPASEQPGYDQKSAGSWQAKVEMSARLMQALRSVRNVPPAARQHPGEQLPPKCSLLGTYEQMGPGSLDQSRQFWESAGKELKVNGVRLRARERLCAVALVKRFAPPAFFAGRLQLPPEALRFEDTASVAAVEWLDRHPALRDHAEKQWSSHWLHWSRRDQEKDEGEDEVPDHIWTALKAARAKERPPAYYAILMMDGDHLGRWLRGEKSPSVRQALHPQMVEYFKQLGPATDSGLNARRPVSPAFHAAISEALANFALDFVPQIVEDHHGMLIYAGGDDVLALLPTSQALSCALALRETFQTNWKTPTGSSRERLLMGGEATVSAGLAVVHFKEDLRFALQQARRAEKAAKDAGRNALQVIACRRSGEHSSALCPWEFVKTVGTWAKAFRQQASDRWAYHLAAEVTTLQGLQDPRAMQAEIRRQVDRAEEETRRLLRGDAKKKAGEVLASQFQTYCQAVVNKERGFDTARALDQFITLCQTASFLARGRDQ